MTDLYFDTAYVCKCYLNEPDSVEVRERVTGARTIATSSLCIAEFTCTIHRSFRDGVLTAKATGTLRRQFAEDIEAATWTLLPITERVLWKVEMLIQHLPKSAFLRAGDAIHLASAIEAGFDEIWTNDRHLLAAAKHFGLKGRSV